MWSRARTASASSSRTAHDMEHLRGVVERITYQNAENGYSVIKCAVKGYNDLVTVVGSMPDVHVGSVTIHGTWSFVRIPVAMMQNIPCVYTGMHV